jgi:putative ABC transport system permease protein
MHSLVEAGAIALDAIWAFKLRSVMTVLGNIVAVTSIVAVVSLIRGLNVSVQNAIVSQAGADSFSIQQFPVTPSDEDLDRVRYNPRITVDDARAIRQRGSLAAAVMLQSEGSGRIAYRGRAIEGVSIQGVTSEFGAFSTFNAERGRLMSPLEVERSHPVAVIGWEVADILFGPVDPLEKTIQIEGVHFRVVGVSAKQGYFLGQSLDDFAVVPLGRFQAIFGTERRLSLVVRPRDLSLMDAAIDDATVALRVARRLRPNQEDNFGTFTSETFLGLYQQATTGIFVVLVGVVALSLLVGGIVIMNIMLMAVTERTREIGLRKALGARRSAIMAQLLTESIVLSVFGGVIGTMLGSAVALTIARFTPVPAAVEWWSVALGIGITGLVGLFFGLYPAFRAARLDPIEALRRE